MTVTASKDTFEQATVDELFASALKQVDETIMLALKVRRERISGTDLKTLNAAKNAAANLYCMAFSIAEGNTANSKGPLTFLSRALTAGMECMQQSGLMGPGDSNPTAL